MEKQTDHPIITPNKSSTSLLADNLVNMSTLKPTQQFWEPRSLKIYRIKGNNGLKWQK